MATTTNFGWETPDDTDLVKDGAAAMRTLGNAIDTSMVDLKGGTTGQVLKKNSNTDMDFIWSSDASGMTNPMTTTGDTIYSSSGSTPARLGIGTAGQVLSVNSGATAPEWKTISSGGMTLINTGGTSLTGASVTISSIPSTYNKLEIYIVDVSPATDVQPLWIRFNSDSGATSYAYRSSSGNNNSFVQDKWSITDGDMDSSDTWSNFWIQIPSYATSGIYKLAQSYGLYMNKDTNTNANQIWSQGAWANTSAISSITVQYGSGNLNSGTIYVYGVK